MLYKGNSLGESYSTFQKKQVKHILESMPPEQRASAYEKIQARQFLQGGGDPELLKLVGKYKGD